MMYGYPDSNCSSASDWKKSRALIVVLRMRSSATSSSYFSEMEMSANGLP